MGEFSTSAVVVLPAVYPEDMNPPVDPHVTLLWLGDVTEVGFTKEDVVDGIRGAMHDVYLWAQVKNLLMFGPNKDVPVLKVEHEGLDRIYRDVRTALGARGIFSASEFPFNPHVTINPEAKAGPFPDRILLTPVELWWKDEKVQLIGP